MALATICMRTCNAPKLISDWQDVAAGRPVDWGEVFPGYRSQVDWPGAHVWRQLSVEFPEARVIHTIRPEELWWNSFSKTIGKLGATYRQRPLPPHVRQMLDAAFEMIDMQTFGGRMDDRDTRLLPTESEQDRCAKGYHQSGFWFLTFRRAGSHSVASLRYLCLRHHFRTSTYVQTSGKYSVENLGERSRRFESP